MKKKTRYNFFFELIVIVNVTNKFGPDLLNERYKHRISCFVFLRFLVKKKKLWS